ncbi:MAG: hypothetical protein ACI9S8_000706 [Chlamydiales bacterium]|jgi:hypothetical protein
MTSSVSLTSMAKKPVYQEFFDECVVPVRRSPIDQSQAKTVVEKRTAECAGENLSKVAVQSHAGTKQRTLTIVNKPVLNEAGQLTKTTHLVPEPRRRESSISAFFADLASHFPCNLKTRIAEQETLIEQQRGLIEEQNQLLMSFKAETRSLKICLNSQSSSAEELLTTVTDLQVIINEKDQRISEFAADQGVAIPNLHEFLSGTDGSLPSSPRSPVVLAETKSNASRPASPLPSVQGNTSEFELLEDYGMISSGDERGFRAPSPVLVEENIESELAAQNSGSDEGFTIVDDSGEMLS